MSSSTFATSHSGVAITLSRTRLMKPQTTACAGRAFTRLELLMVMICLSLIVAVVWPAVAAQRPRTQMIQCLNNLRRIGQGFQLWAGEHEDRYPWRVPSWEGGARGASDAASLFRAAALQFGSPKVLVCPGDWRAAANSFELFDDANLSYFAGLHANLDRPRLWLSGDRNISGIGQTCQLAAMSSTRIGPETRSAWDLSTHVASGNVLFGDGSAVSISNRQLPNHVVRAAAEDPEGFLDVRLPW